MTLSINLCLASMPSSAPCFSTGAASWWVSPQIRSVNRRGIAP
jgi:hypothetical protein